MSEIDQRVGAEAPAHTRELRLLVVSDQHFVAPAEPGGFKERVVGVLDRHGDSGSLAAVSAAGPAILCPEPMPCEGGVSLLPRMDRWPDGRLQIGR